ncbi:MAG: methyl-accepting chemotaxis protein [Bacteroidota bacterium]
MKTSIKMTIKTRLIILSASLVLLLFTVGLFSISVQNEISKNENIKIRFKNILLKTLELRKAEKDFLLREPTNMDFFATGNSKYVAQFDTTMNEISVTIDELKKEELVTENNFKMDELMGFYKNYGSKFHELVNQKHKRGELDFGLIGKMRSAIHDLEDAKGSNALKENQILLLRKTEKDYLLRANLEYVDKYNNAIDQLLSNKKISRSNTTVNHLTNYKNAFNVIVALDKAVGFHEKEGLMSELRGAVHQVEPTIDEMITSVEEIIVAADANAVSLIYTFLVIGLFVAVIISVLVIRSIVRSMQYAVITLDKIANGDLNVEIEVKSQDEIGVLLNSMKFMATKLKDIVTNIQSASFNITSASTQMNSSAQVMSEGATEQASSVEEISSSMEEMAANIQQNTNNSVQTEKMAQTAAREISEGNESVHKTIESMKTIANKISIVGEIARQTNLLALNAAVEAARAGEHGRGFAVVAAEVRKLAERSQEAATEINNLSFSSVDIAQKSGELLNNVVPNIRKTAELVQEITAASKEQNAGSEQVNSAIQQLNQVVQSNAATAEELAATSEELNAQAEQLTDMIGFFKIGENANLLAMKNKVSKKSNPKPATIVKQNKISSKENKVVNLSLVESNEVNDFEYERF